MVVEVCLVPLLAASWFLLAAIEPSGGPGVLNHLSIGFLLGTMFGQASLAAAWTALGPLPLLWRLPLSILWIAALVIALLVNVVVYSGGKEIEIVLIMAACMSGQWLLAQIPLWGLAIVWGMRLQHRDDTEQITARDRQFGTRQLMILTAIVAVVLGTCRWILIVTAKVYPQSNWREAGIFVFLAGAAVVSNMPLIVAALLPRFAVWATIVVLALVAIFTWWELPLINKIGGGPDFGHLAAFNAFQAAWVVGVIALVRRCGFHTAGRAAN